MFVNANFERRFDKTHFNDRFCLFDDLIISQDGQPCIFGFGFQMQKTESYNKLSKMKKIWIFFAATCFFAVAASAQETDLSLRAYAKEMNQNELPGPPENVINNSGMTDSELKDFSIQTRESFYSDFGYMPITRWEISEGYDIISFVDKGVQYSAYYDLDDGLVGTISNISVENLPAHALENIYKKYKGYSVGDAVFFDDNELNETDMIYYGKRFNDDDKYFVELKSDKENIVVQVNDFGDVSFFTRLK